MVLYCSLISGRITSCQPASYCQQSEDASGDVVPSEVSANQNVPSLWYVCMGSTACHVSRVACHPYLVLWALLNLGRGLSCRACDWLTAHPSLVSFSSSCPLRSGSWTQATPATAALWTFAHFEVFTPSRAFSCLESTGSFFLTFKAKGAQVSPQGIYGILITDLQQYVFFLLILEYDIVKKNKRLARRIDSSHKEKASVYS